MCARYVLAAAEKTILQAYAGEIQDGWLPHYNIAPTIESLVITADEPNLIQKMHLGLVPHFAKSTKLAYQTWNARSEEIMTKNTYRPLLVNHIRCLVLASGFYEANTVIASANKQPYYFQVKNRPVFAFAGLWSRWLNPSTHQPYFSFTIMTTGANHQVGRIHQKNRMPVILDKSQEQIWLSKDVDPVSLLQICDTFPDECMKSHPVDRRANNVDRIDRPNNDPGLIEPYNGPDLIHPFENRL